MKALEVFLCIALGLCSSVVSAAQFEVVIGDHGFSPRSLMITKGDTVRWINNGTSIHSATAYGSGVAPTLVFDSGLLNPGESFEHTFIVPGNIGYTDKTSFYSALIGINGVTVSPGNSVLLTWRSFDLIFFLGPNAAASVITVRLDDQVIYNDNYSTFLQTLANQKMETNMGSAIVIPIQPNTFLPGVYTLTVNVVTPAGSSWSDEVTYTVLRQPLPPPLP